MVDGPQDQFSLSISNDCAEDPNGAAGRRNKRGENPSAARGNVVKLTTFGLYGRPRTGTLRLPGAASGGHNQRKEKPMIKPIGLLSLLVTFMFTSGCTMTSTSKQWNTRVGPNGKPVYVKSHTNIGMNVAIFIPILGRTT